MSQLSQGALQRKRAMPAVVSIPGALPIAENADEIRRLLGLHQVLVVAGETGSGKTTQLPKICLQAGFGVRGLIGHTQPRRLAAIAVANRICEELGMAPGTGAGYKIRFADKTSPSTLIKLMTDGVLLNEIQQDRWLRQYEVLIVDEAHERSLNIDFILGYLHQLLPRRPDLKLIITSATIDPDKFSSHFNNAPIVTVSGRSYPVSITYQPIDDQGTDTAVEDPQTEAILACMDKLIREPPLSPGQHNDVLVFLSSEKEIRETALAIRKHRLKDTEVLPLYARLRQTDQERIFAPHRGRRIILATNIAETSLTVPGIRYVIDTGLARISRYSVQSKIQRLPVEPVSRASANQRAGRCGRLSPGHCIRLYSESDFFGRPEFTDPEILRTNLAAVILQMLSLQLGAIQDFPFLDCPATRAINDGFSLLYELNAIDDQRHLTAVGRKMAVFPIDPRFSRILLAATRYDCLREILIIVSGLSIQDPREPVSGRQRPDSHRPAWADHADSDFLTLVNLWDEFERRRQELGGSQLRKFCRHNELSFNRMQEWRDVHRQLVGLCHTLGHGINKEPASYEAVHRSLVAGLMNFIGVAAENGIYLGVRNRKFRVFRSSGRTGVSARWVVSSQIIETDFAFASMAARIEPEWVIFEAGHLVNRSWHEPHWSRKQQQVLAYEKTQLYGLVLEDRKTVNYGPLDPEVCRELFIQSALVEQELQTDLEFFRLNRQLLADLARDEEKLRREDLLADPRKIERFYEEHIPASVWDRQTFLAWYNRAPQRHSVLLTVRRDDLVSRQQIEMVRAQFPDFALVQQNRLPLNYRFEPGAETDGAVIDLPLELLSQMRDADLDWVVPGQLRERCIFLIKSLPKNLRKNFIPVPAYVDSILKELQPGGGSLLDKLISTIARSRSLVLEKSDFDTSQLPDYLKVKLRVLDSAGKVLALDNSLSSLQERLVPKGNASVAGRELEHVATEHEQKGLKDWTIGELPLEVVIGSRVRLLRFPALVDCTDSVTLTLLDDRQAAFRNTRQGIARLCMLRTRQQCRLLHEQFQKLEKSWGLKRPEFLRNCASQAVLAVYLRQFGLHNNLPRTQEQFEKCLNHNRSDLVVTAKELGQLLDKIVDLHFRIGQLQREIAQLSPVAKSDIETQLQQLFVADFMTETEPDWLAEYPRYLQAIQLRLEKIPLQVQRDLQLSSQVAGFQQQWQSWCAGAPEIPDPEARLFRWMIEELRVSLFAQQLRTRMPVSASRLEKHFSKLMHDARS